MSEDSSIRLSVPGTSQHIALARLVTGGVATMGGMPMARVEDARIVVDEICLSLIEIGGGSPLSLTLDLGSSGLQITGTTKDERHPDGRRSTISRQILDVLTNDYGLTRNDGHATLSATIPAAL